MEALLDDVPKAGVRWVMNHSRLLIGWGREAFEETYIFGVRTVYVGI